MIFKTNRTFTVVFYTMLLIWTSISVILFAGKISEMSATRLCMIIFIIFMTWRWSLSLVYCMRVEESGKVSMKSLLKLSTLKCSDFRRIDGPPLNFGFGFMRFRTTEGNFYTYFSDHKTMMRTLDTIRLYNPEIRLHRISSIHIKELIFQQKG